MKTFLARRRALFLLPLLVLPVALLAFACGGGGEEGTKEAATTEGELFVDPNAPVVDIDVNEWSVKPQTATAAAGAVTFNAENKGASAHELVLIKTDTPADQLPVANGKVDEDAVGEVIGEIEDLGAGLSVAATFDLAPGHYAFICNYEGHYQQGMHADFTVGG